MVWLEIKLKLFFLDSCRNIIPKFPKRFRYFVANISSHITSKLDKPKISSMKRELQRVFGDEISNEKMIQIIKKGICQTRENLFETWLFPKMTRDKIRKMVYFEGKENLDQALTHGNGVIIALTHFGFNKIIIPALGYEGYKVNQIASRPTELKESDKFGYEHYKIMESELQCEKSLPANFIYTDQSLRPILRALYNNEILITAIDGNVGHKRISTKFFQCIVNFSPTPMLLALKTGAPVLPTFIIRRKNESIKIIIENPLSFKTYPEKNDTIAEALNDYREVLERYVSAYPCHYVDYLYRARLKSIVGDLYIFQ